MARSGNCIWSRVKPGLLQGRCDEVDEGLVAFTISFTTFDHVQSLMETNSERARRSGSR